MQCPVDHVQMPASNATGKCPSDHGQQNTEPTPSGDAAPPVDDARTNGHAAQSSQQHTPQGKCPFPHAATAAPSQTTTDPATCSMSYGSQPSSAEAPQTAQCPMGFSSADGPRMTEFHCVICKSLLYDCTQLGCSCKYCRHCVAAYNDCPLCGADITSRTSDPELQGMPTHKTTCVRGSVDLAAPVARCSFLGTFSPHKVDTVIVCILQGWWISTLMHTLAHTTCLTWAKMLAISR